MVDLPQDRSFGAFPRERTLGVMGGGQLGRMFVHAAQRMGFATCVLDPDAFSPAARASDFSICAAYDDESALARLAERCFAVTTEFENVPAHALAYLASLCRVAPAASAVRVAQDRAQEKEFIEACAGQTVSTNGLGVGPVAWARIETATQLQAAPPHLLPGVLKTARLGYDGKGQVRVANASELAAAWQQLGCAPCVLEQLVPLLGELSVIVARGADGQVVSLPVQTNEHRNGVLHKTTVLKLPFGEKNPQNMAFVQYPRCLLATQIIANQLGYVGVLCVEFFVLQDGSLRINELAPRPHNSGHASIEACDLSQFELQVRAVAGLPLVQPRQRESAVMLNLMGDLWFSGPHGEQTTEPPWADVIALPGVALHLYGKAQARRGRKMGHLTLSAADDSQLLSTVAQAERLLGLAA